MRTKTLRRAYRRISESDNPALITLDVILTSSTVVIPMAAIATLLTR